MATCGGAGSRVRRIIRFGFSGISQCGQRLGAAEQGMVTGRVGSGETNG